MNRGYSAEEISSITKGKLFRAGSTTPVLHFATDTRKITDPVHSLFVAIRGENHDGHHFISDAYKFGIRSFIAENQQPFSALNDVSVIIVSHSLTALQHIAIHHRMQHDIPVIGITGSNGKTIVKEWLNLLLSDDQMIARSPRSYNSQLGVALSVLTLEPEHTFGLFEAGISMPGEMMRLQEMIRPSIGIFTNLGSAHQENFGSLQKKAEEKALLFSNTQAVIYPLKYSEIDEAVKKIAPAAARISWSTDFNAGVQITSHISISGKSELLLRWKGKEFQFHLGFIDPASVENAIQCIVTMLYLGYTEQEIASRLERLAPLPMRMELLNGINQSIIINDVYSNDLHSLEIALDFLKYNSSGLDRMVILSDIQQSGIPPQQLYEKVNLLLKEKGIHRLTGIGKDISSSSSAFSLTADFFQNTEEFLASFLPEEIHRKAILVKGARIYGFERITEILQDKTHSTVLEIDLNALSHNLNYFRSLLLPGTRLMVMVKAFGYGAGAYEISSLLEFNKADYLAVAYTDEGVALRKSGVSLPVMVMNPEMNSVSTLLRYQLEPEIYSFRMLHNFYQALLLSGADAAYPIHIKVDTGMHRLGFMPNEIEQLADALSQMPLIKIASVFTHLASTDEPLHDDFTHSQLAKFDRFCSLLKEKTGQQFFMHSLNTVGIQLFPSAQYNMVRLGIGLYGISSDENEQLHLKNVSSLRTVISQIKKLNTGESVGYNRRFIAEKDTISATIPLGYADGLRRSLSNGAGYVMIKGKKAPVLGNVCMDMTMVDITGIDCKEGDPVEIFGQEISLKEFARQSGTIVYEVLTGISQRVKRIYLQE
ncbi:MAG: bifunctional UDP-N-acetylmuramoyl-tripeptide:D-alanyl-D-alanine ligase/alanine racemase [Crocinitomicaceae bacterium]|nr:bifunctional UDP-N-acetylmuramoyl-tripeptide:D-alanyl-D-alanine ligase/alanine racemase [Crocinitomicaceae bacterium]